MFARALKSNVIISMAVLLFLGMILIDLVVVRTFQRNAIRAELTKGIQFIAAIENYPNFLKQLSLISPPEDLKQGIERLIKESDFSCVTIMFRNDAMPLTHIGRNCRLKDEMAQTARKAMEAGERTVDLMGSVWGVFWWQRKDIIIASPLHTDNKVIGGMAVSRNLEGIYQELRRSHKYVFVYLFINIVILTFIGFHRLFKVFLEPIERLAERAEDYQENDEIFFPVRKQDNELQILSKALNSMTRRISEDKKNLRAAIRSLEKTNIELKKAQEEIIRAEKLASVGRLSSGIAHEIGNPIGIVMGYLDLLKQENIPPEEKREFIERTEKEIHRMDTVIRQLLDLSRHSAVADEVVSIHDIIEDISRVLSIQPLMADVQLSLSLDAEFDRLKADPNQIRQVFLNLAINAADAIGSRGEGQKGTLEICTKNETKNTADGRVFGNRIEVLFVDNGPGISSEILDNIFDPFFTTKEPGKGTGLGLYVCFMIVESMGGTILAESRAEKGTTMTITLPLIE